MDEFLVERIEKRLEGYIGLPVVSVVVQSIFAELVEEIENLRRD